MNTAKNIYFWMIFSFINMAVSNTHADLVNYTLDEVFLVDGEQMTGTFDWTFNVGDFEGGNGEFTSLEIPWRPSGSKPPLEEPGMVLTIENNLIEISLDGNFHDYGLGISLKFVQPLSPTQPSPIDLSLSRYECCGNGFKDQRFQSGSIVPSSVPEPSAFLYSGLISTLVGCGVWAKRRFVPSCLPQHSGVFGASSRHRRHRVPERSDRPDYF